MAKIFDVSDYINNNPNRNNFDLTHKVHGTYQFGKLYPILCKPVVPTDSFRIDTHVSLRFMPMPFPTQSNMRAIFHYFYVRTKNIWKNFPTWVQGLEEHTPPYIDQKRSFYAQSSLADHLGIPTSFHVNASSDSATSVPSYKGDLVPEAYEGGTNFNVYTPVGVVNTNLSLRTVNVSDLFSGIIVSDSYDELAGFSRGYFPYLLSDGQRGTVPQPIGNQLSPNNPFTCSVSYDTDDMASQSSYYLAVFDINTNVVLGFVPLKFTSVSASEFSLTPIESPELVMVNTKMSLQGYFSQFGAYLLVSNFGSLDSTRIVPNVVISSIDFDLNVTARLGLVSEDERYNPYYSSTNDGEDTIKVSALPFRAYESIYNAFYRDWHGAQDFTVDGNRVFNKYVTNDADGADTTNYELMHHNWEYDAYTSCLPSPQQDNVPYVGLTNVSALGEMRVQSPDGSEATLRLRDMPDGVQGIEYENLQAESPDTRRFALQQASLGFTIPEFREANAIQRFLELNIRKGYRYIDFIEGHFGKSPKYAEMDMPEFIGGFTQKISVNEVTNTNGVDNDELGAIGGQCRAIGSSNHGVNHYFDDFGFVVGIMCLIPDNAYDCILPKHFNLKSPIDLYFPEFSQLSLQPVTYEEIAPVQSHAEYNPLDATPKKLTDTFGYQRPNHDLVWYYDSVHGDFRNPRNGIGNSVICRNFAGRPELGNEFMIIKPSETDTIFSYSLGNQDVALGEIVLEIQAKRPIPRIVVPHI